MARKDRRQWLINREKIIRSRHQPDYPERLIKIETKTRTLCSCSFCGNPRKWSKHDTSKELTLQERKHLDEYRWYTNSEQF